MNSEAPSNNQLQPGGDNFEKEKAPIVLNQLSPPDEKERASILVVDDDEETRAFLVQLLKKEYIVNSASNGLEAIGIVDQKAPDLIISDVMMPFADGYDLLDHLQSKRSTSDLPVILLSGMAESAERTKGLEKGAKDYVAKPLDSRELLARIRIHLQLAQSRSAAERQIRDLTNRLVCAQDKERKRIGRDLHDQIGQQLTALRLQLELLRGISREAKLVERIEETQIIADQLDNDIDFLTWELHSATPESVDIVGALATYVSEWSKRFNVLADFQIIHLDQNRLTSGVKTHLYRIVQEALHNISKHALASKATVHLEAQNDHAEMLIRDNGVGFDAAFYNNDGHGTGIGMVGMRERAAVMGGEIAIDSAPGEGTVIKLRIPLEKVSTAVTV